jgi:hypothetical protein
MTINVKIFFRVFTMEKHHIYQYHRKYAEKLADYTIQSIGQEGKIPNH